MDVCRAAQSWDVDQQAIVDYVFGRSVTGLDPERTFIRDVAKIPPGHVLTWRLGAVTVRPYWNPQLSDRTGQLGLSEARTDTRRAIQESIAFAVQGSKCVSSFLSGGLDSALVSSVAKVWLAERVQNPEFVALTSSPTLLSREERELRKSMLHHLDCDSVTTETPSVRQVLCGIDRGNRNGSFPNGGIFFQIFSDLIEAAGIRGMDVVLTGDGGNEVFAPDPISLGVDLWRGRKWLSSLDVLAYRIATEGMIDTRLAPFRAMKDVLVRGLLLKKPRWKPLATRLFESSCSSLKGLMAADALSLLVGPLMDFAEDWTERFHESLVSCTEHGWTLADYTNYLEVIRIPSYEPAWPAHPTVLPTVWSPLSSPAVVESAMALKPEERVSTRAGFHSKHLLRAAVTDFLPPQVLEHRKIGIVDLPNRLLGDGLGFVAERLSSESLRSVGIIPNDELIDNEALLKVMLPFFHTGKLLCLAAWLDHLREEREKARRS